MKAKPDINERYVIIMAGGRGERFWPVSRERMPKQLLTLLGGRSFLQQAVDRVLALVPLLILRFGFGYEPRISFAEGMDRTASWFRKQMETAGG